MGARTGRKGILGPDRIIANYWFRSSEYQYKNGYFFLEDDISLEEYEPFTGARLGPDSRLSDVVIDRHLETCILAFGNLQKKFKIGILEAVGNQLSKSLPKTDGRHVWQYYLQNSPRAAVLKHIRGEVRSFFDASTNADPLTSLSADFLPLARQYGLLGIFHYLTAQIALPPRQEVPHHRIILWDGLKWDRRSLLPSKLHCRGCFDNVVLRPCNREGSWSLCTPISAWKKSFGFSVSAPSGQFRSPDTKWFFNRYKEPLDLYAYYAFQFSLAINRTLATEHDAPLGEFLNCVTAEMLECSQERGFIRKFLPSPHQAPKRLELHDFSAGATISSRRSDDVCKLWVSAPWLLGSLATVLSFSQGLDWHRLARCQSAKCSNLFLYSGDRPPKYCGQKCRENSKRRERRKIRNAKGSGTIGGQDQTTQRG